MDQADLVILGSGSTAFAAALRAAELGHTAIMTESRTLGGTCVNRGCLPSKNLIEAARIYWEAQHPRYPGLRPAALGLDFTRLIRQKDEVVEAYRDKKYASIVADAERIRVIEGRAAFAPDGAVDVNGRRIRGRHYLIATGSRPVIPAIEGLDEVPYLTSDLLASGEEVELRELPRSLVIVGGGYIALELGQMFHRFGAQVTILERGPRLLRGFEPEAGLAIAEILREEGVRVETGTPVRRVQRDGEGILVSGDREGTPVRFRAERLLIAAGRAPTTDALGLEHVGVRRDPEGFVIVDAFLRTTASNIWAAGDVIGGHTGAQLATPVGAHDGGIAARNALTGERRAVDHTVIPRTDPPIAAVGLTDEEANRRGHRCHCGTIPMSVVPRAGAVRDPRGLIKMVLDGDTKKVLGVTMVGREAGEVIHEAAMALRFGASVHDFIDMVHVYPTMAEALKIAALSFFKDVERLSCCAE
ncbi:MAG: mercury(II) reductase [Armatimonadota bacterium]|nr:mercury(II) reductase [Armatimonadota bacterium]MDR7468398.1 mercury(II) reductase [Armatimonadota bacterium]MDR7494985.1 mercury(II) reductase [Armatimonadota bacterium]MDR7559563.1 mercury(II) reductase [Armatimonadota bacterium]MDR7574257.1 mercury(II) reductase [Armatimonadota bacterium]